MTTGSDVYSFGVLMWSLFTGQQPYMCTTAGLQQPNPAFPHLPGTAHPRFSDLMASCLRRDPHERPSFADIEGCLTAVFSTELGLDDGAATATVAVVGPPPAAAAALTDTPACYETAASVFGAVAGEAARGGGGGGAAGGGGDDEGMEDAGELLTVDFCSSRSMLASCFLFANLCRRASMDTEPMLPMPQQQQQQRLHPPGAAAGPGGVLQGPAVRGQQ